MEVCAYFQQNAEVSMQAGWSRQLNSAVAEIEYLVAFPPRDPSFDPSSIVYLSSLF